MHRRNDGKPFNAYRFNKWEGSAVAAQNAAFRAAFDARRPVRVSRFRVFLASFIMWVYSKVHAWRNRA